MAQYLFMYYRFAFISIFLMTSLSVGLSGVTYLLLLQIPKFTIYQRFIFSITIYLTNVTFSVLTAQFVSTVIFIYTRSRYLNLLLKQLLNDNKPLLKWYEFISSEQISYNDINYLLIENIKIGRDMKRQLSVGHGDVCPAHIDNRNNNKSMSQLTLTNSNNFARTLKPNIDSIVSTFTLFDIRMLQKM